MKSSLKIILFVALVAVGSYKSYASGQTQSSYIATDVKTATIYHLHDLDFEIVDHFIPTRAYMKVLKNGKILGTYQTNHFDTSKVLKSMKSKILQFRRANRSSQAFLKLGSKLNGHYIIRDITLFR